MHDSKGRANTVKTAQMFAHDPKQSCWIVFELSAHCATTTIYRGFLRLSFRLRDRHNEPCF
jgi:hypothetical protein